MNDRLFVASDFVAMESWLTAFHSKDSVLLSELNAQLDGGTKVHSANAALLYGIDPTDAKTHLVNLKGRLRPAYDAGKRLSHAWSYGMGARQGTRTFLLSESFMAAAFAKLAGKYVGVVRWRETLADRVFGAASYRCPRCQYVSDDDSDCPDCTRDVGVPIPLRFAGFAIEPARVERTRFGRLRRYPGRRRSGQNALASQHPQSCGASMWNITFARLHGYDPVTDAAWPSPDGILRYDPHEPWNAMFTMAPITVATGTYDSFAVECPRERADEVAEWVRWTMEVAWPELDGWRFPAEVSVGYNLGEYHVDNNPLGLRELHDRKAFTMAPRAAWR